GTWIGGRVYQSVRRNHGVIIGNVHARFHVPDADAPGDLVRLPADEAVHATRVMRLKVGDALRVFDGHGREFEAVIEIASASAVHVRLGPRLDAAPESRVAITLAQAILKGAKMDDVVRDSTMMGVAAIQPVVTERAEVTRASLTSGQR